jgi:hypothetical protein
MPPRARQVGSGRTTKATQFLAKGKAFGLIATEARMSFYAVAKCMLSSRGSLRRASARGRQEGFVSSGVVSGNKR